MEKTQPIQPLFILAETQEKMGDAIIQFKRDDYNKALGSSLIDAKDDAEAISTFLRIIGKGKKLREIPIPDELLKALADFRLKVSLPSPQPQFKEKTPLIPMQNLHQPISTRRINQVLKWAFNLGATKFEVEQPRKASKLRFASAHWLRHSYVTYLLDSGASLKVVQENAGHSDIGTTMLYRHVAQLDRHTETKNLSLDGIKQIKLKIKKVRKLSRAEISYF